MPALNFVFAVMLANTPDYVSRDSPVPKVQLKCNCIVKLETGLLAYQALTCGKNKGLACLLGWSLVCSRGCSLKRCQFYHNRIYLHRGSCQELVSCYAQMALKTTATSRNTPTRAVVTLDVYSAGMQVIAACCSTRLHSCCCHWYHILSSALCPLS